MAVTSSLAFMTDLTTSSTVQTQDCQSLANKSSVADPDLAFEMFSEYFVSWFLPVNIILGIGGNIVNLFIMAKQQVFNPVISTLFLSLALADILNLIFAAGYLYISVVLKQDTNQLGLAACKIVPYAEAVGYWLSPWIQATVSAHRMVAVRFPLKNKVWLTLRRTRMIIFIVTLTVVLYAFIIPINHSWSHTCQLCNNTGSYYVYYSHGVFGSFLPFGMMVFSTGVIIYSVFRSGVTHVNQSGGVTTHRGKVRKDVPNINTQEEAASVHLIRRTTFSHSTRYNGSTSSQNSSRTKGAKGASERRITTILILMNLAYFLTNGAGGVFLLLRVHLVKNEVWWIWHTLHRFFDVITCVNNSTNWAFYLLSGAHYRRTFLKIIGLTTLLDNWRACKTRSRESTVEIEEAKQNRTALNIAETSHFIPLRRQEHIMCITTCI